jgi:hypothetical protein
VPRTVIALLAVACCLVIPVSGASATGESIAITPRLDPIAGIPGGFDYTYNTVDRDLLLTIVTRPTASPPCQDSPNLDTAVAGNSGTTYVTPAPLTVNGNLGGELAFTFPAAGTWRVCAWLYGSPDEALAKDLGKEVTVRAPRASLTIDVRQGPARAGGADVLLHAVGATEAPGNLFALALPDREGQCPATYNSDSGESLFDATSSSRSGALLQGPFDENLQTRSVLGLRRWRICAYLQDGDAADSAIALASQFIDLQLKPMFQGRPKVKVRGGKASCAAKVAARPKPKVSVTWLLGSKKVGKGRRIGVKPAWKGKKLACAVTARNRLGKKAAKSRATRV